MKKLLMIILVAITAAGVVGCTDTPENRDKKEEQKVQKKVDQTNVQIDELKRLKAELDGVGFRFNNNSSRSKRSSAIRIDREWSDSVVESYRNKLQRVLDLADSILENGQYPGVVLTGKSLLKEDLSFAKAYLADLEGYETKRDKVISRRAAAQSLADERDRKHRQLLALNNELNDRYWELRNESIVVVDPDATIASTINSMSRASALVMIDRLESVVADGNNLIELIEDFDLDPMYTSISNKIATTNSNIPLLISAIHVRLAELDQTEAAEDSEDDEGAGEAGDRLVPDEELSELEPAV